MLKNVMGIGLVLGLLSCQATADDEVGLWTVQARDTGSEKVCDAFARGMNGRPLYEFRFRRSKTNILLIVSYDGPRIAAEEGDGEIIVEGQSHVLPAVGSKFDGRNAVLISISPKGFDFHQFDRTIPITIRFGGDTFNLAFLDRDHLGDNMDDCLRQLKIE